MIIKNLKNNKCLSQRAEIAKTPFSRAKGLIGRQSFEPGQGLVITSCNSIHMFFMSFAIDAVFIDRRGVVVGLVEEIKPNQISSVFWKATCAIELPIGTIRQTETSVGDVIEIKVF